MPPLGYQSCIEMIIGGETQAFLDVTVDPGWNPSVSTVLGWFKYNILLDFTLS